MVNENNEDVVFNKLNQDQFHVLDVLGGRQPGKWQVGIHLDTHATDFEEHH